VKINREVGIPNNFMLSNNAKDRQYFKPLMTSKTFATGRDRDPATNEKLPTPFHP
jgi:hypothetical protein